MAIFKCCFETQLTDFFEPMVQKCTDPGCKYTVDQVYESRGVTACRDIHFIVSFHFYSPISPIFFYTFLYVIDLV